MNVIRLMGGLGNQLFQYALGRAQKENGIDVAYDITKFRKGGHRSYMLGKFNIDIKFSPFLGHKTIADSIGSPSFNKNYLTTSSHNFFGYWQYLDYFKHILPKLREEIRVKEEYCTKEYYDMRDRIVDDAGVALHVRRTDYLTSDSIDCIPVAYYTEALKRVSGNVYVFSDDIEWCRSVFKKEYFLRDFTFINSEYHLDFELMGYCRKKIIANSTFSWWSAILTRSDTVITPNLWITKLDRGDRNNFPNEWIRIDV